MDAMTQEDLEALEERVTAMEEHAANGKQFTREDQEFHRLLYRPLHNDLLSSLLDVFWNAYRQIHLEVGVEPESLIESANEHRQILESVRSGNKPLAAELVSAHFRGIRERLAVLPPSDQRAAG